MLGTFFLQGQARSAEVAADILSRGFADGRYDRFTAVSAFASSTGVQVLADLVSSRAASLEKVEVIVGVDLRGTSREALEQLLALPVEPFVYYTVSPPIFHPKLYLFEGRRHQSVLIGSSNLTGSGLFVNTEGNLFLESGDALSDQILAQVNVCLEQLRASPNLKRLSTNLIADLVTAGVVPNEAERRRLYRGKPSGTTTTSGGTLAEVFPPVPATPHPPPRRRAPPTGVPAPAAPPVSRRAPPTAPLAPPPITPARAPGHGPLLWRKKNLRKTDAQVSDTQETHITGELRFTQARFKTNGAGIDQTQYFRHTVFGHLRWRTVKTKPLVEAARAKFNIRVRGTEVGQWELEVSHKPQGEAGQGNFTTSLRWGDYGEIMRGLNVLGLEFSLYGPPPGQNEPFFIEIS